MSLALEIAQRATDLNYDSFDPEAIKWAKDAIADMIGCALLGANSDTTLAARNADNFAAGSCLILGRRERLGRLDAAFVNGTSGHALDYDDTSKSLSGHPTVIIIPGLLALAETIDAPGKDLVDAYIVGVEAATRIARGVNFHHYEKGWHPTATLGIFGAAVAASRLLKLNAQQMAHSLAIAASLASGTKANFGTSTKPMHAGLAARNGLFAALLASKNIAAAPDAFEHPQGFLEVFNGAGNYNVGKMLTGWAEPLDLLSPGISIKKYPCVYSVHGAIDAAIALHNQGLSDTSQVEDMLVMMHPRRLLPHVRNPATSALNAKFSLSYSVARGLVNGAVSLDHFDDEALHDPEVTRIMQMIRMEAHDDDTNDYGATVKITLKNGETLEKSISAPLGRGPEVPLPAEMLRAKFNDCASRSLTAYGTDSVFNLLMSLEKTAHVKDLTREIEAATLAAA